MPLRSITTRRRGGRKVRRLTALSEPPHCSSSSASPPARRHAIFGRAHVTTTQQTYTHVDEVAHRDAPTGLNKLPGSSDSCRDCDQPLLVNRRFQAIDQTFCLVGATGFEAVGPPCMALPSCRMPSLTGESGFPCHSLNRRMSHVVAVSLSDHFPGTLRSS